MVRHGSKFIIQCFRTLLTYKQTHTYKYEIY